MVRVTRGYPHIEFRYTVAPSEELPSAGFMPIYGSVESVTKHIEIGYRDGKKAIEDAKESGSNSNLKQTMSQLKKLAEGKGQKVSESTDFLQ